MRYTIRYSKLIDRKYVAKIPQNEKGRIKRMIEEKLGSKPEVFGKPLRKSLKGCRGLRIGNHRIIFRINEDNVDILLIEHRSTAYKNIEQRLED